MTHITRICSQCGQAFPLDARHCTHCGYDSDAALTVRRTNLPAVISKAALPVLVGAASLAISAGWKLLQGLLNEPANPSQQPIQVHKPQQVQAGERGKFTIHISTSWAVGDSTGNWRQGHSEQTIEFDE